MPTQATPIPTPSPVPKPAPVPATIPATAAPPSIAYDVECVGVDSMEKNVTILEHVPVPGKPEETIAKPHTCVRRCWDYKFELDPKPVTHPAVTIVVSSLEPLPFQIRQRYTVSFQ